MRLPARVLHQDHVVIAVPGSLQAVPVRNFKWLRAQNNGLVHGDLLQTLYWRGRGAKRARSRYKYCNKYPIVFPSMPYPHDDMLRVPGDVEFNCELRDGVAMVVLHGGKPSRRWRDATRLRCSALVDLDPAAILFVEFDPVGKQFSLLHLRWSDRLWSYCYLGATTMSEAMTAALGLRTQNWRRALAHPVGTTDPADRRSVHD